MAGHGISGSLLKGFLTSMAPILLPVALGGALGAKSVLSLVHVDGMITYLFWVGLPALVFRRLALSDPHSLNLRLLGADALGKVIPFVLLMLWRKFFSRSGRIESFEWVITFFMLSTLPNTVLIGDSVLNPMFGTQIEIDTTAIIFAQSLYWYNSFIVLFEIRELMLEDERIKNTLPLKNSDAAAALPSSVPETVTQKELEPLSSRYESVLGIPEEGKLSRSSTNRGFSSRSLSHSFSSRSFRVVPVEVTQEDNPGNSLESTTSRTNEAAHGSNHPKDAASFASDSSKNQQQSKDFDNQTASKTGNKELEGGALDLESEQKQKSSASTSVSCAGRTSLVRVTLIRMFFRIFKTPLIYASIFGFTYSLFAAKYNWLMPNWVLVTLSFLADGTIGLAMVCMGIILAMSVLSTNSFWGLVPCGMKWLWAGFAARFIAAPIIMYLSCLPFQLKGTVLRYAVVQVVIAQGSMGFALAKQYNCKMTIMLTASMVQMLAFIPAILLVYEITQAL